MADQYADPPVVAWAGPDTGPLVVLLHGRGADERGIVELSALLPGGSFAAVRGPIPEGGGYAWFANRGIGRPVPASLAESMAWFRTWLDGVAGDRPVLLAGFSGGAGFAGGLILADPGRYAGAAILYGTLPFDAGVPATPGRLTGLPVLAAQGSQDPVIPRELLDRTWTYLHGESGARTTGHRDDSGHALSPGAIVALSDWLGTTVAGPP
jgi:phospholipase/carboxylesterase